MLRLNLLLAISILTLIGCLPSENQGRRKNTGNGAQDNTPVDTNPGSNKPKKTDDKKQNSNVDKHTVLVIDDGFDENHEVFKGQVVGTYRLVCDDAGDDSEGESGTLSDDKFADFVIDAYKSSETSCSIKKGVNFSAGSDLKAVAKKKDSWNKKILNKTYDGVSNPEITDAILGVNSNKNYHGTMVAGVIGYQNEDTNLVFLQIELQKPQGTTIDTCPDQKDIDQWVRVHKRKAVRDAYVKAPPDAVIEKIMEIVEKHKITIVNASFGSQPRAQMESDLVESGCPRVDYKEYFAVQGELDEARYKFERESDEYESLRDILAITAAGNDGVRIDSRQDAQECYPYSENDVLAGAYDYSGKRSQFSNYGKCVDFYVLGSQVITAAPLGFLVVADGTSFAAPMLARHISRTIPANAGAVEIRKRLKQEADSKGFLPKKAYPAEIAFENSKKMEVFALVETEEKPRPRKPVPRNIRRALGPFGR